MIQFAQTGLLGYRVKDSNFRLRFFIIIFMGIIAFGAVLFWRSQLLFVAEYQEFPVTNYQLQRKKQNILKQMEMQNQLLQDLKQLEEHN